MQQYCFASSRVLARTPSFLTSPHQFPSLTSYLIPTQMFVLHATDQLTFYLISTQMFASFLIPTQMFVLNPTDWRFCAALGIYSQHICTTPRHFAGFAKVVHMWVKLNPLKYQLLERYLQLIALPVHSLSYSVLQFYCKNRGKCILEQRLENYWIEL